MGEKNLLKKKIVFYITNHGYGHAARNVPIIESLLELSESTIIIKSDAERCAFLHRNLVQYNDRISYEDMYYDVGLLLKDSTYEVDIQLLTHKVEKEISNWNQYVVKESHFLAENRIDVVISDIIPWVLTAAKRSRVPSILLCNFTWYEMYKEYLPENLYLPYYNSYCDADKIFLYDLGNKKILDYYKNVELVSLISRKKNDIKIMEISQKYPHPIVFVSVGKSIVMEKSYDVSDFKGTVIITAGVELQGTNVIQLSNTTIDTQNYICASDYIISKTGWSTLAEIFLSHKRTAVIVRGNNPEDNAVIDEILKRNIGIKCDFDDLNNIQGIVEKLNDVSESRTELFEDCHIKIAKYILSV